MHASLYIEEEEQKDKKKKRLIYNRKLLNYKTILKNEKSHVFSKLY